MRTLEFAARATGARLMGEDRPFETVSTDSRSLTEGALFFALTGPNFDGADYLAAAAERGAVAAVVSETRASSLPLLLVDDTRIALGRLGAALRDQCHDTRVVGITGSNGKTTLKELTAACLSRAGKTLATEGNLNNEIGVPLMLSRLTPDYEFAVFEMGANHAGEIAYLAGLVKPTVAALSNAGPAHLEGFGSLDGVSRAKGELLAVSPRPATAVLNADDRYYDYWRSLTGDIAVLSFGLASTADVRAERIELEPDGTAFELATPSGRVDVRLALTGEHNVRNACAAAAIAHSLGVGNRDIALGLGAVRAVSGRLRPLPAMCGARVYDDSYNANPTSVIAAARFLASLDGRRIFVLGDMKELGEDEVELTRQCGRAIAESGIDRLFALGPLSQAACEGFGDGAVWFDSRKALIDALIGELADDVAVLVKGSRSMAMETVVEPLLAKQGVH